MQGAKGEQGLMSVISPRRLVRHFVGREVLKVCEWLEIRIAVQAQDGLEKVQACPEET